MTVGKTIKFKDTKFEIITSYASSKVITAVTKANPAVVTAVGHGYTKGDVVRIEGIVGMEELNDALYVVGTVTTDTFELIDVDSTAYGTWVSGGTASKGIYSSSCEITDYTGDSGATTETSTETNCGISKDFGSTDPGTVSVSYNKAPNDFQEAVDASRKSIESTALRITLPKNNGIIIDIGVVTQTGNAGTAGGLWTGSFTMTRKVERIDLAV